MARTRLGIWCTTARSVALQVIASSSRVPLTGRSRVREQITQRALGAHLDIGARWEMRADRRMV